jgi:hypothetical protein
MWGRARAGGPGRLWELGAAAAAARNRATYLGPPARAPRACMAPARPASSVRCASMRSSAPCSLPRPCFAPPLHAGRPGRVAAGPGLPAGPALRRAPQRRLRRHAHGGGRAGGRPPSGAGRGRVCACSCLSATRKRVGGHNAAAHSPRHPSRAIAAARGRLEAASHNALCPPTHPPAPPQVAYLSAAVWFGAAYWSDKWELLHLSRRPVAYGGGLSEAVTNMLPFATARGAAGRAGTRCGRVGSRRHNVPLAQASKCRCAQAPSGGAPAPPSPTHSRTFPTKQRRVAPLPQQHDPPPARSCTWASPFGPSPSSARQSRRCWRPASRAPCGSSRSAWSRCGATRAACRPTWCGARDLAGAWGWAGGVRHAGVARAPRAVASVSLEGGAATTL